VAKFNYNISYLVFLSPTCDLVIFLSTPKINASTNMNYHGAIRVAYIYQHFHSAHTYEFRITMLILQQNKHTIHELNQKNFKNTQIHLGLSSTLGSRLRREMELAWQGGRSSKRSRQGSSTSGGLRRGELRRTPATTVNSGNNGERESARK
jgi:hypothetical protein